MASLPFAPELAIPAVLEMNKRFGQHIYAQYGFLDAFNLNFDFDVPLAHGRCIPGFGWVDGDYLGIDQGADLHDDRELPQRHDLARDAQESVRPDAACNAPASPAAGSPPRDELPGRRSRARARRCCFFAHRRRIAGGRPAPARRPPAKPYCKFWAMGREGEVVAQLLPEFERTHPGIRVEVQQLPWTAAHEKLLTAFAGDSTPDICQLGNTWIPEFVALGALEPLDRYVADSRWSTPRDYFAGIWDTNIVGGQAVWRALVRRYAAAVLSARPARASRVMRRRRDRGRNGRGCWPPSSNAPGPDRYAILLPLNEFEPLLALALQQDEPLLRDDGRWGNFRSAGFRRALQFYVEHVPAAAARRASTDTDVSNVWNEFGRGHFVFYISGPWNIGEFKRRLPANVQANWMTAPLPGPIGPGASIAGGSSLVVFRDSRRRPRRGS